MSERITTILREKGFRDVGSFDEIKHRFIEFARLIMCSHKLVYGEDERSWRITALELYLCTCRSSAVWRDPYIHANSAQLESGTWYVHDDGHRAPFYSGIDITCGSVGMYGGLLIRELCNEYRWVFQRIIRGKNVNYDRKTKWDDSEKATIQESIHMMSIDSGCLKLVPTPERDETLYIGPRIGLTKKSNYDGCNPDDERFKKASLRIATWQTARLKTMMEPLPG